MKEKSNIDKWIESGFDEELLKKLKEDYPNDEALLSAEKLVTSTGHLQPNFKKSKQDIWEAIESRKSDTIIPIKRSKVMSRANWVMAAASIFFLIGAIFIWRFWGTDASLVAYDTGTGETKMVDLPDRSRVQINAQSHLEFSTADWSTQKVVKLNGEAFFEVVKGGKFEVQTPQGTVTVLGTSFNVKARNKSFTVSCKTGKVKVDGLTSASVELSPGMSVRFVDGQRTVTSGMDTSSMDGWTRGTAYFSNVAVTEVFEELQNQYGITIQVQDKSIRNKQYSGFINVNKEVEQAIEDVCLPLNLRYKFNEDGKEVEISH